jgi:hypothetical protein
LIIPVVDKFVFGFQQQSKPVAAIVLTLILALATDTSYHIAGTPLFFIINPHQLRYSCLISMGLSTTINDAHSLL